MNNRKRDERQTSKRKAELTMVSSIRENISRVQNRSFLSPERIYDQIWYSNRWYTSHKREYARRIAFLLDRDTVQQRPLKKQKEKRKKKDR